MSEPAPSHDEVWECVNPACSSYKTPWTFIEADDPAMHVDPTCGFCKRDLHQVRNPN